MGHRRDLALGQLPLLSNSSPHCTSSPTTNKPVGYLDLVWQRNAPLRLDWWIIHLTQLMILPRCLRKIIDHSVNAGDLVDF